MDDKSGAGRVLWLNGAFGAGKTTVARLLAESLPETVLVDPEEIGSLLRPVLQPHLPVRDFQEWRAWRELVAATLNSVIAEFPYGRCTVVVPQTITNEDYWADIVDSLAPTSVVVPVALHVDKDEHRRRVLADEEEPGASRWRLMKFDDFEAAAWVRSSFTGIDATHVGPEKLAALLEERLRK